MKIRMFTQEEVYKAAFRWYGRYDLDSYCLTENRLNKGELPYDGF